jgi:MFS family permease
MNTVSVASIQTNRKRLYVASCVSMVTLALTFTVRGDILEDLSHQFLLNKEQLGLIAGAAFWGFTLAIFTGGQLCDVLGMGRLMALAFMGHTIGTLSIIFAGGFWQLWFGTLILGLAEKLNALHAWFPGGILLGGIIVYGLTEMNFNWQSKMILILIPTMVYGFLLRGQPFPPTERVQHGISVGEMYKQALRPQFLVWVFCMFLTAST